MVNDAGIATCLEAKTGKVVWQSRVGGMFSASPLYADGRIYLFDEDGKTTVIEAGRKFKVLAENLLDDGFMASPAVGGMRCFFAPPWTCTGSKRRRNTEGLSACLDAIDEVALWPNTKAGSS